MKHSTRNCSRGLGLVAYRRRLFGKGNTRSRQCGDALEMTYFEWLFLHPIENPRPALMPVRVRAR